MSAETARRGVAEIGPDFDVQKPNYIRTTLDKLRTPFAIGASLGAIATSSFLVSRAEAGSVIDSESHPVQIVMDEDRLKNSDFNVSLAEAQKVKETRVTAVRETMVWVKGQRWPSDKDFEALNNSVEAAKQVGLEVILSVYPCSFMECPDNKSPNNSWEVGKFTNWLAYLAYHLPDVHTYIIGDEPNSDTYWRPQEHGASFYYRLLSKSYDVLKKVEAQTGSQKLVGGGATNSRGDTPAEDFIINLGRAYRSSGRTKPIMDFYVHHPYPDNSSQPPDVIHPSGTLGMADYGRLVRALGAAFDGTTQAGSKLPIDIGEIGWQTETPDSKADDYRGSEQSTTLPVDAATQGAYMAEAIDMATKQPNIFMFSLFLGTDERNLKRWQSGLYYYDNTPKKSLPVVRQAAMEAQKPVTSRTR